MAFKLSPAPGWQVFTNGGTPGSGYKVFFYAAGSFSTLQSIYSDYTGATPLANPVVANSSGRLPAVFLDTTLGYNVVLSDTSGTTVLATFENVFV